ncbi:MAG: hypothetical protein ACPGU5_06965 [Lishizhenia sp.]
MQSSANNQILEVYIKQAGPLANDAINGSSINDLNLLVYPNPNDGLLKISFELNKPDNVTLTIHNVRVKLIEETVLNNLNAGKKIKKKSLI